MKRGFTLIEMLGILVVLAVIIIVSLPSIVQTSKNSRQAELDDNKKTIYMAAETYIDLNKDASANLKKNKYYYVKLTTLVDEGLLSSTLKNPANNLEKTVAEGRWWVEARMNNGKVNYSLVNENPYEDETKEAEMVYTILINKHEVERDKLNSKINRYIMVNSNPNNYVRFNNELWRIVALENDYTIKMIKDESIVDSDGTVNFKFGTTNDITTNIELIQYLNGDYYSSMAPGAQNLIVSHNFTAGTYNLTGINGTTNLLDIESKKTLKTKIGLLNPSDYIQASENEECTIASSYTHTETEDPCLISNYLYKGFRWWMMNPASDGGIVVMNEGENDDLNDACKTATEIQKTKDGLNSFPSGCLAKIRLVVYLNKDTTIASGSGSRQDPYILDSM